MKYRLSRMNEKKAEYVAWVDEQKRISLLDKVCATSEIIDTNDLKMSFTLID